MFISDGWKEYRLIDAEGGERLEYWNGYLLIRPDPQIIWSGEKKSPLWKKADGIYRREGGGGSWIKRDIPEQWNIGYKGMTFELSPMGFKHTGLFPEQAANWDWFMPLIENAGRPIRLLNLFAYTGAASIAAAKAGAHVCHVDASKGMVQRAKKNAELSGIRPDSIRYIVDDCEKFVAREIRRGSLYDAVILDPPSYGRGPGGEKWLLEQSLDRLIGLISGVLTEKPLLVLLNSYTTGLSASTCGYILGRHLCGKYGGSVSSDEIGIPVESSGMPLPCGAASRWTERNK